MNILLVCTGNTCRSSMAEAMMKNRIKKLKEDHIYVHSAGLYAQDGQKASCEAIKAMNVLEIDLTKHRSKPITIEALKESDLVLCMTMSHKIHLLEMAPWIKEKVYTLKEYAGEDGDILDPFGQGKRVYELCAHEIHQVIIKILEKITQKHE